MVIKRRLEVYENFGLRFFENEEEECLGKPRIGSKTVARVFEKI